MCCLSAASLEESCLRTLLQESITARQMPGIVLYVLYAHYFKLCGASEINNEPRTTDVLHLSTSLESVLMCGCSLRLYTLHFFDRMTQKLLNLMSLINDDQAALSPHFKPAVRSCSALPARTLQA